jgi:hypothetical protein
VEALPALGGKDNVLQSDDSEFGGEFLDDFDLNGNEDVIVDLSEDDFRDGDFLRDGDAESEGGVLDEVPRKKCIS